MPLGQEWGSLFQTDFSGQETKWKLRKKILISNHLSNISGLYAVTPNELDTKLLVAKVEAALKGGVRLVQYRNKAAGKSLLLRQATALLAVCRTYDASLIINDHLDLCAHIDADGLHLGATDCKPGPVRRLLGADKIIGVSCYNQLALANEAEAAGADYVAFGACFSSDTKPNAVNAPLSLFAQAKQHLKIPIVGIGGINLDNALQIKEAGADAVAVISTLFEAKNITTLSQQFNSIFKPTTI
jgi:thiamine-phosphate pyrophosphorylase